MSEWQLIETAPKDGKSILLYGDMLGEIYVDAKGQIGVGSFQYGEFVLDNADAYTVSIYATHWMPLPEPPK